MGKMESQGCKCRAHHADCGEIALRGEISTLDVFKTVVLGCDPNGCFREEEAEIESEPEQSAEESKEAKKLRVRNFSGVLKLVFSFQKPWDR